MLLNPMEAAKHLPAAVFQPRLPPKLWLALHMLPHRVPRDCTAANSP